MAKPRNEKKPKIDQSRNRSFSIIELLVVIAIISILSALILVSFHNVKTKACNVRAMGEVRAISQALELYFMDNNYKYPCDVNRDLPPGLEKYLSTNPEWPKAPWPGSVYDWDYWAPSGFDSGCAGSLSHEPKDKPVYQISVRFCDINGDNCNFPKEKWAEGFDSKSSVYWCLEGPCRAHGSYPYDHPGCCMGGACPADQPECGF